jgi:hypothetical protein
VTREVTNGRARHIRARPSPRHDVPALTHPRRHQPHALRVVRFSIETAFYRRTPENHTSHARPERRSAGEAPFAVFGRRELTEMESPAPTRRPREANRAARLLAALEAKTEHDQLLYTAQALILCGLPYAPTTDRTIIREGHTSRGRVRVTFRAALQDVPLPYGKDAVLLTFLTTKAILGNTPTINFATAKEYLDLVGEDVGGRSYRLLAERWRRLAGLVISVERHGETSHDTNLQVVISRARLPARSTAMASRAGFDGLPALHGHYAITLGHDFWQDLRACAVPLLLPVMRAFANRPLAWHFVQFIHWRSYVSLAAADRGHHSLARINWSDLRLTLGSATSHDKQLRRELRTVITDLKFLWPELNASFDGSTLCIGPPQSRVMLVDSREQRFERRAGAKWTRLLDRHRLNATHSQNSK